MTRADPEANSQCRALVVIDLAGGREPQALDRGGEFPIMKAPQRGVLYRLGLPVTVTPVWSPDGRWIAYLRRDHGTTQLWRARSDGSGAQVMTHSAVDIEDFTWSPEQRRWIFAATPGLREAARQIDREETAAGSMMCAWSPMSGPDLCSRPRSSARSLRLISKAGQKVGRKTGRSKQQVKRSGRC
jgi:Tol biopolymer transport system component